MKKIKINFVDFWPQFKKNDNFIIRVLAKYYIVELSDEPEYLFYSVFGDDYLNYDGIKIRYNAENVRANFNFCDYAIDTDYITFEDRHFRLPFFLIDEPCGIEGYEMGEQLSDLLKKHHYGEEHLKEKTKFCSFVYSNSNANEQRAKFFYLLSEYKKVNSGGGFLNNIGGRVENKVEFEKQHKFAIAFENSSFNGYTTEKLINSLSSGGIPIYWGDPLVGKMLNTKRFVNTHDYENFEEVINRVREIDHDDALYLKIINEPITLLEYNFSVVRKSFEEFLCHIIDQPLEKARRRAQGAQHQDQLERREKYCTKKYKKRFLILRKLYQPFRKIKAIDAFKQKIIDKNSKEKMPF